MKKLFVYNLNAEKIGYFSIKTDLEKEHYYFIVRQLWCQSGGNIDDLFIVPDYPSRVYMSQKTAKLFASILRNCESVKLNLYIE